MISPSHHYDVYIDPAFKEEQQQSINNALLEWQFDTNQTVTFTVVNQKVSYNPIIVIMASDKEYFRKHHHSTTVGVANFRGIDTNIFIDVNQNKRNFHQISLHELGHALGLEHDDRHTVMYEWTDGASSYLTCKDMKAFCKEWNCDADSFVLCHVAGIEP
jgi:predicted Zn-dependent protease